MTMFGVICSKSRFSRQLVNYNLNVVSFCVQGQPGLEIRKQDHLQTCFDAMNAMETSEFRNEHPLEITFFEVSLLSRFS